MEINFNDLTNISDEDLIDLYYKEQEAGIDGNTNQMALKILLNSGYGSLSNAYFQFFDLRMADSITKSGQCAVKWMERYLNSYLNKYFSTIDEDYVITIDTDSVVGDTKIIVNNKEITIEDYYNSLPDNFSKKDNIREDYVKVVNNGDYSLSFNDLNMHIESNRINYIMKHKVFKKFYKITNIHINKSVIVTEDHSVIVERNNEFISIKPKDINQNTDCLIYLYDDGRLGISRLYKVEDLGIKEDYVYDIEVEHNHNFFANGILVHNSLYLNLQHLIDKIKEKQPNLTDEDCINILDKFAHEVIEKQIEKGYEEFYKYTNSFENQMVMKRECLCSSGVFVAKKRYVLNVFDNEGVRYEKPKLKIKGLDVVRSSTPAAIKDDIKEVYKILLDKTESELQDYIGVVKEKYKKLTLNEISIVSSISDIDKYTKDSNVLIPKGCPMHVRGAIIYNKMIKDLKLEGKYQPIKSGDKIKYVFLQMPNHAFSDVIAYLNYFPEEFELEEYIDYDRMFERSFIGSVENVTDPIKWSWKKKNSIDDLFG